MTQELLKDKHMKYLKLCMRGLPSHMASLDATRMTIAHLCLVGLAALGKLDEACPAEEKKQIIDWIYGQQVLDDGSGTHRPGHFGFRGGSLFGPHDLCATQSANCANVAATYSALSALVLLGDDLARVDKPAIVAGLRDLQLESGCFVPHVGAAEQDPRFIYCACAVSTVLGDWSGIDTEAATRYIVSTSNIDGGLAQAPFNESHGGHLYCCIASLVLMGRLDALPDRQRTLKWALQRQVGGFQGRANKPADVCYSFWVGGAIDLLGGSHLVDGEETAEFIYKCQNSRTGGVCKSPGDNPDPLHTALGIVGYGLCRRQQSGQAAMSSALLLPTSLADHILSQK